MSSCVANNLVVQSKVHEGTCLVASMMLVGILVAKERLGKPLSEIVDDSEFVSALKYVKNVLKLNMSALCPVLAQKCNGVDDGGGSGPVVKPAGEEVVQEPAKKKLRKFKRE